MSVEISQQGDQREYDEAVEALRQAFCKLPRYSFFLNKRSGVSRVKDRVGHWVNWDDVHELLEPERVDWLIAQMQTAQALEKAKGA